MGGAEDHLRWADSSYLCMGLDGKPAQAGSGRRRKASVPTAPRAVPPGARILHGRSEELWMAPAFLMMTRYEQVRSVVAAIAGDAAADDVRLVLPETSVCTTQFGDTDGAAASGCRGGPAQPKRTAAAWPI